MSSLLSQSEIDQKVSIFARHFDTFSSGCGNYLVIYKEPLKVVQSNSSNVYAGYEESSNEQNYTYVPVSGRFPVLPVYDKDSDNATKEKELQTFASPTKVRIKVREDAKDYIKNGRNERFEMNGVVFNAIGE